MTWMTLAEKWKTLRNGEMSDDSADQTERRRQWALLRQWATETAQAQRNDDGTWTADNEADQWAMDALSELDATLGDGMVAKSSERAALKPGDVVRATRPITDVDSLGMVYVHADKGALGVVLEDDFRPEFPVISWQDGTGRGVCNVVPEVFEVVSAWCAVGSG